MVANAMTMVGKYTEKYLDEVYQAFLVVMEEQAKTDYSSAMTDWVIHRDLTVGVLNSSGVQPVMWGGYLAFSSTVWRLTQAVAGQALSDAVHVYLLKWVGRGLTQVVLETIRTEVYNIPHLVGENGNDGPLATP